MAGQRDTVGLAHWCAFTAGLLMTAAAYGDEAHLRCLLYAGIILTTGMGVALVFRWGFSHRVPGSVTPISDAPSALELAAGNELRIGELELRADVQDTKLTAVYGAIDRRNQANGFPAAGPDDAQPVRLHVVPRGEASLCGLAAALALRGDDRPGVALQRLALLRGQDVLRVAALVQDALC